MKIKLKIDQISLLAIVGSHRFLLKKKEEKGIEEKRVNISAPP